MWKYVDLGESYFKQNPIPVGGDRVYLGHSFYSCNYICPECQNHLLKSNIKNEFKGKIAIKTDMGDRPFSSVFYCHTCSRLFTTGQIGVFAGASIQTGVNQFVPASGNSATLGEGKVFVLTDPNEVMEMISIIDNQFGAEVM